MWSDRVYKSWNLEWKRHSIIGHHPRTTQKSITVVYGREKPEWPTTVYFVNNQLETDSKASSAMAAWNGTIGHVILVGNI